MLPSFIIKQISFYLQRECFQAWYEQAFQSNNDGDINYVSSSTVNLLQVNIS